jgi:drug/metabolite transporter (DMT)-like permease
VKRPAQGSRPGAQHSLGGSTIWGPVFFALLCMIWGSTWLVIKIGYGTLGPFNVAALRFFIAGTVMTAAAWMTRARWPRGGVEWTAVALVGLLVFAAQYGLIYWAEQYIESGLTAVLYGTLPLMTLLVARAYIPGERITAPKLASALLALLGTVALFGDRLRLDSDAVPPMLAVLGATFCAATASVVGKRDAHDIHPVTLNAPSMLIGATTLLALSFARGDGFAFRMRRARGQPSPTCPSSGACSPSGSTFRC